MKLKEYLASVKTKSIDSITMKPSGNVHNSCVDPSVCLAKDVDKLLRLVEIMSGALIELNRKQFAGCGTCPSGLQEHQQIAQDARVECERILSE